MYDETQPDRLVVELQAAPRSAARKSVRSGRAQPSAPALGGCCIASARAGGSRLLAFTKEGKEGFCLRFCEVVAGGGSAS